MMGTVNLIAMAPIMTMGAFLLLYGKNTRRRKMLNLNIILNSVSPDLDFVCLNGKEDIDRFWEFVEKEHPSADPVISHCKYKNYNAVGIVRYNGRNPHVDWRYFGYYMKDKVDQGAKIWELDDFIAHYHDLTVKEKRVQRILRGLDHYFAQPSFVKEYISVEDFFSGLTSLFGNIVFHVPHASLALPKKFEDNLDLDYTDYDAMGKKTLNTRLRLLNLKVSDVLLLDLIQDLPYPKVSASYSRLYCDLERYWNDKKEPMAKLGMGAIYTKDIRGLPFKSVTPEYRRLVKPYYQAHHKRLKETVEAQEGDEVLLIDLHSFGPDIARVVAKGPYPDVCIGYNEGEEDELLIKLFERFCDIHGLTHKRNYPYQGAMTVPHIKTKKVRSIMIEINKRVYL